jgi:hypothetical protein
MAPVQILQNEATQERAENARLVSLKTCILNAMQLIVSSLHLLEPLL